MNTQIRNLSREILEILALDERRLKTRLINASTEIGQLLEAINDDQPDSIVGLSSELKMLIPRRNFAREIPTLKNQLIDDISRNLFLLLMEIEKAP